jgi:tripartite-type tricarboxylate transporter receptor subunit TctC
MMTGLDVAHVFYSGDVTALKKVVAGELQTQFAGYGAAKEYVASGKLRALAVTSATRERGLPDVPTIGEFVRGYELTFWTGIGAPRNTSSDIVARLSREITASLSDSSVLAQLSETGHVPMPLAPAAFEKLVADETGRLRKLVNSTGIKPQ